MMKILTIILMIMATWFISGCQSLFFRSIQGTSFSAGISIPTQDTINLQVASYLSGESIAIRDKCQLIYWYNVSITNNYFGIITTQENRNGIIGVK